MHMRQSDHLFAIFKNGGPRLEAVKLREYRLLCVGLAVCGSTTQIFCSAINLRESRQD
jgi:hypothetical protein